MNFHAIEILGGGGGGGGGGGLWGVVGGGGVVDLSHKINYYLFIYLFILSAQFISCF